METFDAIAARRQRRNFADTPLSTNLVKQLFTAAGRAPSAHNRQRWDFVVVTDAQTRQELTAVWQGARWVDRAPVVVALVVPVASDPAELAAIRFDAGQAAMLVMLAATDLGLATGQAGCEDQVLVRSVLALPEDRECAILIAMGYPRGADIASVTHLRRKIESTMHLHQWSSDRSGDVHRS